MSGIEDSEVLAAEAARCAALMQAATTPGEFGVDDPAAGWVAIYLAAGAAVIEQGDWAVLTASDGARLVVPVEVVRRVLYT